MTKTQVMALLRQNRNPRGEANWKKQGDTKLKSFGIGLTQLRKLARQVGRDHKLAAKLWASDNYDAKVLGLLIDEPAEMSREQAEAQVEQLEAGMLAHVFASCDATLAKTPFARELAVDWMERKDHRRKRCGYLLLYELGKNKKDKALDDAFFLGHVERIAATIHDQENWVRDAMNTSLLSIGKRNRKLNKAVIQAAKRIGEVEVDYGPDTSCEPLDIGAHMTADYVQKKLG